MSLKSRWRWLVGGVVLVAAAVWGWHVLPWPGRPAEEAPEARPPDPRLSYQGPWRNIHPKVKYVGDAVCAECHPDIATTYHQHPMGRSLAPVAADPVPLDAAHNNPFKAFQSVFRVEKQGDQIWHHQQRLDDAGAIIYDYALPVHYVVGSGNHGRSYLSDRDGFLFMSSISWYDNKAKWDVSPNFDPGVFASRSVVPDCLFCHCNKAVSLGGAINHYKEPIFDGHAIGCERCHGPGELHVQGSKPGLVNGRDYTIVQPKYLPLSAKEAVCEQCHLEGVHRTLHYGRDLYDFRPGLLIDDFWTVFVPAGQESQDRKVVNHVEQMHISRCYQASVGAGKLHCISCHNPHEKPAPKVQVAYFRQKCQNCHGGPDQAGTGKPLPECALPLAKRLAQDKQDNCVACHMPAYGLTDVTHAAFTNHRIIRHKDKQGLNALTLQEGTPTELVSFHRPTLGLSDPTLARDCAITLVQLALAQKQPPANVPLVRKLLDEAVTRYPDDREAWECKAILLKQSGQAAQSLAAFRAVLDKEPDRETALIGAAACCRDLQDLEGTLGYWRQAVHVNPWNPDSHANLAVLLEFKGEWQEAKKVADIWLKLEPESALARKTQVSLLLHAGKVSQAKAEFAKMRALAPPQLSALEAWFEKQLHAAKGKG
jgi:tetratricopeptide (TPR) repeat protein